MTASCPDSRSKGRIRQAALHFPYSRSSTESALLVRRAFASVSSWSGFASGPRRLPVVPLLQASSQADSQKSPSANAASFSSEPRSARAVQRTQLRERATPRSAPTESAAAADVRNPNTLMKHQPRFGRCAGAGQDRRVVISCLYWLFRHPWVRTLPLGEAIDLNRSRARTSAVGALATARACRTSTVPGRAAGW